MTLRLVVNNDKKIIGKAQPTCRLNCELFDHITNECGIKKNIKPDDPYFTARCGDMIYKEADENNEYYNSYSLEEDIIEDDFMYFEFNGSEFDALSSTYPLEPDYPSNRDDAIWYISPNKDYGCWIINKYRNFKVITQSIRVEKGWSNHVYKSPYPLHNHNALISLSSRMAWYVDEEGYGQYVVLANGKVSEISSPRPFDWN